MNAEKCSGTGNVCCGTGHVCRDCDCAKLWARCDRNNGWLTVLGVTVLARRLAEDASVWGHLVTNVFFKFRMDAA